MTDSLLRQRYIAAGLIRPNTKELEPIQLCAGAIVFRIKPGPKFEEFNRGFGAGVVCWH